MRLPFHSQSTSYVAWSWNACEHANALAAYVCSQSGDDAISSTFEIKLGPDKDLIDFGFLETIDRCHPTTLGS